MKRMGFFIDESCMLHDVGPTHPESPNRILAIETQLQKNGLKDDLYRFQIQPAQKKQLTRSLCASCCIQ